MSAVSSQMQLADDEDPTMVYPARFDHDLFYVAPFYHKFFPDIDKIIVLDLDLEFRLSSMMFDIQSFNDDDISSDGSDIIRFL